MCLSDHCPNKEYIMTATGPYLTEASSLEKGETYLEAALREWLVPTPGPCGTQFTGTPPASADPVLGSQCHDLASGQNCKPYVCNGVCTHTERRFCNGMPFALPISLHHFATNGLITEPSQLPDTLTVQNKQFQLNGCTFWNGNYYNGCFRFMSQWFTYDSLLESRSRGSGVVAGPLTFMRTRGFTLSSCVYFEVQSRGNVTFLFCFVSFFLNTHPVSNYIVSLSNMTQQPNCRVLFGFSRSMKKAIKIEKKSLCRFLHVLLSRVCHLIKVSDLVCRLHLVL